MRCIAIAQAWQMSGGRAIFALAKGGEVEPRIVSEGAEVARIRAEPGSREDAAQTVELCARSNAEWLVVDGYHFPVDYCGSLAREAAHLLLVDDGPEPRTCDCDVVLIPDLGVTAAPYARLQGGTQLLLGPQFALLRQEFREFPVERLDVAEKAKRVLVTMGGGDAYNVTLQVVEALREINDLELEITVVAGASYQQRESLQAAVESSLQKATLLWNVKNMADLMTQADLAITAGGGTCYELAFMRVPMFLITVAKSQELAVRALSLAGAAWDAGWFSSLQQSALAASLRRVIGDRALRRKLAENAGRMIDGKGADRVVETMLTISHRTTKLRA
jgi:UDP-2,4-diacetamido-2,4,6-trideoxy-beta-L-altropyranose hydrolase